MMAGGARSESTEVDEVEGAVALGKLEQKVSSLDKRFDDLVKKIDKVIDDQEKRLRVTESAVNEHAPRITTIEQDSRDHEKRLRSVEKWVHALPPSLALSAASIAIAVFRK